MSEPTKRTPPRLLEVTEARLVSPRVRRITLGGAALHGLDSWPAAHIKLFFPRAGQHEPTLPGLDARGRPVWPPLPERPVTRTYSVRRHDPARQLLEVDFVLHEPNGPAGQWAQRAAPGMRIGLAGPGGPRPLLKSADWYLLAGDLSALAAMAALIEALPSSATGVAFVQIPHEADKQTIVAPSGFSLHWLISDGRERPCTSLFECVKHVPWTAHEPFAFLAGEGGQVVAMRDFLREQRGLPPARIYAVPYWKRSLSEEQYHAERHRVMDELDEAAQ